MHWKKDTVVSESGLTGSFMTPTKKSSLNDLQILRAFLYTRPPRQYNLVPLFLRVAVVITRFCRICTTATSYLQRLTLLLEFHNKQPTEIYAELHGKTHYRIYGNIVVGL